MRTLTATLTCLIVGSMTSALGASYHVDSGNGNDENDGLSPKTAWSTLEKASGSGRYKGGDRILLKRGSTFKGKLALKGVKAAKGAPLSIDAYGDGKELPKIDSAGYIGGVTLEDCAHVTLKNLEITSDGGKEIDNMAKTDRYGVLVSSSSDISIDSLRIHTVFATIQTPSEGKDNTTAYGNGVGITESEDVSVANCEIERVGRYGINLKKKSSSLTILNNRTDHTGCSGIQLSTCKDAVIRGNVFNHSGSFVDERMHGRGSGSWVWGCENVLYEKNSFMNAKGKADSAGVHIDFNCKNIVIQHCFSMNNEGGFIEILGNNHNCSYRYNISVNDGSRTKRKGGAHQEGKVFWLSGFVGSENPDFGPFNCYIYNNTIYVKEGAPGRFSIAPTTEGAMVANNIFHLLGPTSSVADDQKKWKKMDRKARGVVFQNNVYIHDAVLPADLGLKDISPVVGDSRFKNPGGTKPQDYIPANAKLLKDKGIKITKMPGDQIGLTIGLDVKEDFFGNPIKGAPDIGAVEIGQPIRAEGFPSVPGAENSQLRDRQEK